MGSSSWESETTIVTPTVSTLAQLRITYTVARANNMKTMDKVIIDHVLLFSKNDSQALEKTAFLLGYTGGTVSLDERERATRGNPDHCGWLYLYGQNWSSSPRHSGSGFQAASGALGTSCASVLPWFDSRLSGER